MPASAVIVTPTFIADGYDISYMTVVGGVAEGVEHAAAGDQIEVAITPDENYSLIGLTVSGEAVEFSENEDGTYTATFTMPEASVVVMASFQADGYTVAVASVTGGTVEVDNSFVAAGETVTITITANDGYTLTSIKVAGESIEFVDNGDGTYTATFVMPEGGVTIVPAFTASGFEITYAEVSGGSLTGDTAATYGSTVVVEAAADYGYTLTGITVTNADGESIDYSGASGTYYFYMPAGAVSVSATFQSSITIVGGDTSDTYSIVFNTGSENETDTYSISVAETEADSAYELGSYLTVNSAVCNSDEECRALLTSIASGGLSGANAGALLGGQHGKLGVYTNVPTEVRVYSLKGALVKRQNVPAGTTSITGLTPGVYFVRVTNGVLGKVLVK